MLGAVTLLVVLSWPAWLSLLVGGVGGALLADALVGRHTAPLDNWLATPKTGRIGRRRR